MASETPAQSGVPSILDSDVFALAGQALDNYPDPAGFEDFGAYRIYGEPIGRGGMGEVFLAEDQNAGRRVAIKFLHNLWLSPALTERFAREIKTLAKMEHPFIARLYDAGIHPSGTPYFAMEYVEGKPLDEYCRDRQCSPVERLRLFRSVCEGVQYAHSLLIVHCDLKPSNILVKKDGTPKLLDFGIARQLEDPDLPASQTHTASSFTPAFAAPEQLLGRPVGVYTDVYALGAILYQLLTGKLPYDVENCSPGQAAIAITGSGQPEKPSSAASSQTGPLRLPRAAWNDLDVLCLKALRKDVARRYRSVVELAQDVDHYLQGEPLKARPDTLAYRAGKFLRRRRRAVLSAAAGIALIAGLSTFYAARLAKARDAALTEAARAQRIQRFMLNLFGSDDPAPPEDLRATTILDRGVREARLLRNEPAVQAALYQTLGSIYQQLGDLDRADSLLQSSLGIDRAAFGPDSLETANGLALLSLLRVNQARFADAERLARKAVSIDQRHSPADPLAEARTLTALGSVLHHRGNLIEAKVVLTRAVQLQSTERAEKADVVEGLTYLSNAEHSLGDNLSARTLMQQALNLDRQIYGDRHPAVAEDLSNLEGVSDGLGKYAEAERYGREAMDIVTAWYGKDHPETALVSEGLAKTLVNEGKYDEAIGMLNRAIATQERAVGKMHPYVGIALNWRGAAELKRGDLASAEVDFGRCGEIFRKSYGADSPQMASALFRVGELRLAQKRYADAENIFIQCAERFSRTLSPDDVRTGTARVNLGDVLFREQRYKEAESELLAGYRIVTNPHSASLEPAAEARRDLVSVYQALNLPDKAAKFR